LSALGRIGTEAQEETLGDLLPSYAEALAVIGEDDGLPTTLNTMSVNPFTTPYAVGRTLLATGEGRYGSAYDLAEQFSPAVAAMLPALTGRDPRGYPARGLPGVPGAPGIYGRQLVEGLPEYRYPQRIIEGTKPTYVYPETRLQSLLALLAGTGVTPRRTNVARLREEAERGR
jgi:hypothetical protein